MQKILDSAVRILTEEDVTALNTNRIADEAGVNISTLYSYFPDKTAILREAATRMEFQRSRYVLDRSRVLATSNWREWKADVIDTVAAYRRDTYGAIAVRQAVMSLAELREIDEETTRVVSASQIDGLLAHSSTLTRAQATKIARLSTETIGAVLDIAFRSKPHDWQMIEELKRMIIAHLSLYLDK